MSSLEIYVQPTPNPNALKYICSAPVKNEGKSTYNSPDECVDVPMASEIFKVRGVSQIHFFGNAVTVTKFGYEDWEEIEEAIEDIIRVEFPNHNPDFLDKDPEAERRKTLSPELQEIEAILDRTVRPYLQGDGGDLQCMNYVDNVLTVQYLGACGSCPSSETGTLHAIQNVLKKEYNEEIEVYAIPSFGQQM